jgi:hypothetical protein
MFCFKFVFVEDDGREGADDNGVYLGLHCFDVFRWELKQSLRVLRVEV